MKRRVQSILAAAMLLTALTGCAMAGKEVETASEGEAAALTIRIINQSDEALSYVAASYAANGETLGSRACVSIEDKSALTKEETYEFGFLADELPVELESFRIDLYVAEKANEDYTPCGSASIQAPKPGDVYTLSLNGDFTSGLYLSAEETDSDETITVFAPGQGDASFSEADAESLVYVDDQGTGEIYSRLNMMPAGDGYAVELDLYRTGSLSGKASDRMGALIYTDDFFDIQGTIQLVDNTAVLRSHTQRSTFFRKEVNGFFIPYRSRYEKGYLDGAVWNFAFMHPLPQPDRQICIRFRSAAGSRRHSCRGVRRGAADGE